VSILATVNLLSELAN